MPVLRLFAAARAAAGTSRERLPGATVGEVLNAAVLRFGPDFAEVLAVSRVWVNGEPASPADTIDDDDDEVAVLPPVSGGAFSA